MSTSKTPKRVVPAVSRKRKAAGGSGPLTLAQAREIAGVMPESSAAATPPAPAAGVATKARRAAAPRRAPAGTGQSKSASGLAASIEATPATVAMERRNLKKREREQRKQRTRDYKATLELLQKHGVKGLPVSVPAQAPQRADAKTTRRRAPSFASNVTRSGPLRVLAEGDSWFEYPFPFFGGGLVPRLEDRLGVPILNLAKAGDETRFMLGVEQRQLIARHLNEGCTDGTPWELMLFSGGGNDIAAQPLAFWLRDFKAGVPPASLLNQPRFKSALDLVRAAYEDLIEIRNQHSPGTHLVFHGYDFAIPDGRGICGIGPWLKPAFDVRGFPADLVVSTKVVREMLTQLATLLKSLAAQPGVSFIDAQGTLTADKASWHNELHPSKSGFNQIADKFHAAIKLLFPGRVVA